MIIPKIYYGKPTFRKCSKRSQAITMVIASVVEKLTK